MKDVVKRILRSIDSDLHKNVSEFYHDHRSFQLWRPKPIDSHGILDYYSSHKEDIFFIQVGSNDGVAGDPIHEFIKRDGWHGILVEPVEYLFRTLVENYKGMTDLIFENAAISDKDGQKDFYYPRETSDKVPGWYGQIGSFRRDVILKHQTDFPNIEDYIDTERVDTLTFDTLLTRHRVAKVDLINIDTEGYDVEIIRLIDFTKIHPDIVLFENKHLEGKDYRACNARLKKFQYDLFEDGADTIALARSSEIVRKMERTTRKVPH